MSRFSNPGKAFVFFAALLLASCSSPSTNDMYKGEVQKTKPVAVEEKPSLSPRRLAAIKALGLDHQTIPSKLVGLSQFDVKQALGTPSFVRKDKGVEVWQYRSQDCILDLFLYESRDGFSVDHSELRGSHLDSAGELSCFKAIVMGSS